MRRVRLGVNVDHVATVRQARYREGSEGQGEPDPLAAAREAVAGGADGITVHLREDRRHIQESDLRRIRRAFPKGRVKLNLEMAPVDEILRIALSVRPDRSTLVPERRQEVTTEGGLDLARQRGGGRSGPVGRTIRALAAAHIEVSLFIDPEIADVERAFRLGAGAVEIHTGAYANARSAPAVRRELLRIARAARRAGELGLSVYAGHGLRYAHIARLLQIPEISEVNIGHSIVSRALFAGMRRAVREMKRTLLKRNPCLSVFTMKNP